MSRRPAPAMILDLPDLPARNALRAGLMAMRVPPGTLPADRRGCEAVLRQLVDQPESVAFIDISRSERSMRPTLLQLDAQLPRGEWRLRVFLTRLADSHVSESDRGWAASMVFPICFPNSTPTNAKETCAPRSTLSLKSFRFPRSMRPSFSATREQ